LEAKRLHNIADLNTAIESTSRRPAVTNASIDLTITLGRGTNNAVIKFRCGKRYCFYKRRTLAAFSRLMSDLISGSRTPQTSQMLPFYALTIQGLNQTGKAARELIGRGLDQHPHVTCVGLVNRILTYTFAVPFGRKP
jgi:hypothetical protein